MRRFSLFLALAVLLLSAAIGYTYKLRWDKARRGPRQIAPEVRRGYEAVASSGWQWGKDDPVTNKPMVRVYAKSFQATHDPSTFELHGLWLKLYNKDASAYTYISTEQAFFNEGSQQLKSDELVRIVMNVATNDDAENKDVAGKHVQVQTSGVAYDTKTGKASTEKAAKFTFPSGSGSALGADYDPTTRVLHMKSAVALDWVGNGPVENKMHIETNDLVYKELEQKVYLTPWAKLQRQTTTIQCQNVVVTLQDQRLHQIDGDHAFGNDNREDRQTAYSADRIMALFNEDGVLVNMIGDHNAKVISSQPVAVTTLVGDRADMRFAVETKLVNGAEKQDSNLHLVLADGHAVAESRPQPRQGVELADTRTLRSDHIELELKPDGKDLQEIRTSSQSQLEFTPNRPTSQHRTVDASHLRVLYGEGSYADTFLAWNVATRTDRQPKAGATPKGDKPGAPPAAALTWSDELRAKFQATSNDVATVEQIGNFRYQEGVRKASSKKASLDQKNNRMVLVENARVSDDTGSTTADQIVMDQSSGDMTAEGRVVSTHAPDKNEKPGTSMLDNTQPMQAKADNMSTRDKNSIIHYEGHAVMWQGANRIRASVLDIDRDEQTLRAKGNVVSELTDTKKTDTPGPGAPSQAVAPGSNSPNNPTFTTIYAPQLIYRDDTREADYSGGVKLVREKMTITSRELLAFLTPKTPGHDDSSLDHAFADGDVTVVGVVGPNHTRTGTSEHCEYWTNNSKVILSGGSPELKDSYKGITRGRQLTYFGDDDRLIVDGMEKKLAFTEMKKK
ncbi:MAG: LptA/OstA family protein [Bryobacteraceae bacterium]